MIHPPPTPTRRLIGQQRLQPGPFLVSQIMTMQHRLGLPHPVVKIRGTRSNGHLLDLTGAAPAPTEAPSSDSTGKPGLPTVSDRRDAVWNVRDGRLGKAGTLGPARGPSIP